MNYVISVIIYSRLASSHCVATHPLSSSPTRFSQAYWKINLSFVIKIAKSISFVKIKEKIISFVREQKTWHLLNNEGKLYWYLIN